MRKIQFRSSFKDEFSEYLTELTKIESIRIQKNIL